jgi:hypothetical protein
VALPVAGVDRLPQELLASGWVADAGGGAMEAGTEGERPSRGSPSERRGSKAMYELWGMWGLLEAGRLARVEESPAQSQPRVFCRFN